MSTENQVDIFNEIVRLNQASKALGPSKLLFAVFGIVAIAAAIYSSVFTVDPTDVAYVRHIDGSVNPTPYTNSGFHFKIPFLDTVDRIQISENIMTIPRIVANATDDPGVKLDLTLNVEIPRDKAYHLLYEVGRPGNVDINENVIPVVQSYVIQQISGGPASELTKDFGKTQAMLTQGIGELLDERFGIQLKSFNISNIDLGEVYVTSSQQAVRASNAALQATYAAEKQVTEAKANADVAAAQADGQARATITLANAQKQAAQANADSQALVGDGEKRKQQAIISAFGSVDSYIHYMEITRWSGNYPYVMSGGSSGGVNTVVIPTPTLPNMQSTGVAAPEVARPQ